MDVLGTNDMAWSGRTEGVATRPPGTGDPGRAAFRAPIARSLTELARTRRMAVEADRPDLVERLDQVQARLAADDIAIAVVGEFKQGKSTLVNALLRTDVCPVDADIVTAVPTIVRYGAPPSVLAHTEDSDGPATLPLSFAQLRQFVTEGRTEEGDGGAPVSAVEVHLDRLLLRRGLSFIDTPGVGGLESAHGNLTLGVLQSARAALFVTDAAQELTAPELDFLTRTVERCPTVVCVVTKIDLQVEWRRIVELNRGHLTRAGLNLPMVPVSSFLRLRAAARDDTALNAESGFPRLLEVIRRGVVAGSDAADARTVKQEIALVLGQLRDQVGAERVAAQHPAAGEALAENLAEKARRSRGLATGAGSWQTVLADGIQDLTTDVDHDLRERLRAMMRRGEALIDDGDPKDDWPDFEAWAAREGTRAAVDNLFTLVSRAEQLARDVAERFDLEYASLDLDLPAPAVSMARIGRLGVQFDRSAMRQFLGGFTAVRLTAAGLITVGAVASLPWLALLAPIGLAAGMTVGRKLIRSERARQVEYRRQQAKQELRRYVDEIGFVVGKESRDAVRRAQRFLRDEFAGRAALTERSSVAALEAVRRTAQIPQEQRAVRARELDARLRDMDDLAERIAAKPGSRR
jgi:hypothetical protein